MSPFKVQVRVLRTLVRKPEYDAMWDVNTGPTEVFQGLERGVVVLYVTRARKRHVVEDQKLGWAIIGTPNKMNVALSRAKYGLIVVSSPDLLKEDPDWREFSGFCDRNGLVAQSESLKGREQTGRCSGGRVQTHPAGEDHGGQGGIQQHVDGTGVGPLATHSSGRGAEDDGSLRL